MDSDKRKYPRVESVFKLNYSKLQREVASFTKSVSLGGVSFATDEAVPVGSLLRLVFSIEGLPGEITANGVVARAWEEQKAHFAAVEFLETPGALASGGVLPVG